MSRSVDDKLAAIRQLYFDATPVTIQRDFDRAIDLLRSMESEAARERATVYMHGLAELKREFSRRRPRTRRRRTTSGS